MNPTNSMGQMVTQKDWQHVFSYDITDFAHLLVDSVEIDAFYLVGLADLALLLILNLLRESPQEMS